METSDVNLMPLEVQEERERQRKLRSFNLVTFVFLGVALLAATGVFGYQWWITRKISLLEAEIAEEKRVIGAQSSVEILARNLSARADSLSKILAESPHYSRLLEKLSPKVPPGIRITDLTVVNESKITLGGEADGYLTIAKFVKALSEKEPEGFFSAVYVPRVSLDSQTAKARFGLDVYLEKGALTR